MAVRRRRLALLLSSCPGGSSTLTAASLADAIGNGCAESVAAPARPRRHHRASGVTGRLSWQCDDCQTKLGDAQPRGVAKHRVATGALIGRRLLQLKMLQRCPLRWAFAQRRRRGRSKVAERRLCAHRTRTGPRLRSLLQARVCGRSSERLRPACQPRPRGAGRPATARSTEWSRLGPIQATKTQRGCQRCPSSSPPAASGSLPARSPSAVAARLAEGQHPGACALSSGSHYCRSAGGNPAPGSRAEGPDGARAAPGGHAAAPGGRPLGAGRQERAIRCAAARRRCCAFCLPALRKCVPVWPAVFRPRPPASLLPLQGSAGWCSTSTARSRGRQVGAAVPAAAVPAAAVPAAAAPHRHPSCPPADEGVASDFVSILEDVQRDARKVLGLATLSCTVEYIKK
jgi:hypothetical protein